MSYNSVKSQNNVKNDDALQDLPDQKYKKKKVKGFIVVINIILYGFGSILLINFVLRELINKKKNVEQDHLSFQNKTELDIMKFKFDQIFYITYLHSSCLLVLLLLKLFQIQKPNKKAQNKLANQQQLSLSEEINRFMFSFSLLFVFFLNSIYSAWIVTSQIQMKKLNLIIILHLVTHIYSKIAEISHQVQLISSLKNLMLSLSIVTHLIILLNNNDITNPLKIELN
ncbi:hypothetical protein ABPG74_002926 [Tetrahymena malaccensis]